MLCTNKKKATYKTAFQKIKEFQPAYSPNQINVDYELAAINAIKEVFPNAIVQGCYFHLAQSLGRNIGTNGLKPRYETDSKFASEIRKLQGLAFLPVDQVN